MNVSASECRFWSRACPTCGGSLAAAPTLPDAGGPMATCPACFELLQLLANDEIVIVDVEDLTDPIALAIEGEWLRLLASDGIKLT